MAGSQQEAQAQALEVLTNHFPSLATTHRTVRCIVKLGGAAITRKSEFETLNEPVLAATTLHLRDAMGLPFGSLSMDWSRKDESSSSVDPPANSGGHELDFPHAFIVVHGAGWFLWSLSSQPIGSE
jgi:isopentenyl phosphate kinase